MTFKSGFLLTVLLMAIFSLTTVASSAQSTQVAEVAPRESNPPTQLYGEALFAWSTNCSDTSTLSKEPGFIPAPKESAAFPCGPCSLPACQGQNVGDFCGIINGTVVHCVWTSSCGSGPGTGRLCTCSTPVP